MLHSDLSIRFSNMDIPATRISHQCQARDIEKIEFPVNSVPFFFFHPQNPKTLTLDCPKGIRSLWSSCSPRTLPFYALSVNQAWIIASATEIPFLVSSKIPFSIVLVPSQNPREKLKLEVFAVSMQEREKVVRLDSQLFEQSPTGKFYLKDCAFAKLTEKLSRGKFKIVFYIGRNSMPSDYSTLSQQHNWQRLDFSVQLLEEPIDAHPPQQPDPEALDLFSVEAGLVNPGKPGPGNSSAPPAKNSVPPPPQTQKPGGPAAPPAPKAPLNSPAVPPIEPQVKNPFFRK